MFDWITAQISNFGYAGIAFLMFLENLFPPIPSELIMSLAGFVADRGFLSLPVVILSGTLGSVAGALLWYEVARRVGKERLKRWAGKHGRWLALHPHDFDKSEAWFRRHGKSAVFIGRMVPGIRTLISVPAGFGKMPFLPFLGWTTLGSLLWCSALTVAGYLLGPHYDRVEAWLNPVSTGILLLIAGLYLYRVITWKAA